MKFLSKAHLSALLCLLPACTVGPDYISPDIAAPEEFVLQEILNNLNGQIEKEGEEIPSIPVNWWEGFSDPVLNSLVENGIENNYLIVSAAARVKESRALLKLADAGDSPVATFSIDSAAEGERELDSRDTDSEASILGTLGVVLPLDVFGQIRRQVEAAAARFEAAQADLRGTILTVSSEIASRYLRLRGDQRQLALLEESVALQEKTLSIVKSRYNAGLSPELDVRRAEASVETLRADIPALKESLVNTRNKLATLTGKYPGVYEELLSNEKDIPEYKGVLPELVPLEVLALRPDIQEAESDLKQAIAEIGVAKAEFYPFFDLAAQIGIGSTGISGERMINTLFGSISTLIQQFVADGGARRANLDITKSRAEEALASYRQILLDAAEEVEITLSALRSSLNRQKSLKKAVRASERSFYQAEALYKQGLTSFIDVVDAQRVLASVQQQLASARTDYATQVANLFLVLGTEIKLSEKLVNTRKDSELPEGEGDRISR